MKIHLSILIKMKMSSSEIRYTIDINLYNHLLWQCVSLFSVMLLLLFICCMVFILEKKLNWLFNIMEWVSNYCLMQMSNFSAFMESSYYWWEDDVSFVLDLLALVGFILILSHPVFDISRRLNAACMLKCRYNKYQFYSLWTKQGLKPTGQVNQYTTCWL